MRREGVNTKPTKSKTAKPNKAQIKVRDMKAKKNVKGGGLDWKPSKKV